MHLNASPDLKNIKKKGIQNRSKLKHGIGSQKGHSALLECRLALSKCRLALFKCRLAQIRALPLPEGTWIELKLILFHFLKTRMHPNLYLDHFS